jgi:hypothetical protein
MPKTRDDKIRERAYAIWQRHGRPHGQHDEHWRQAEAEIEAEERAGVAPKASKPSETAEPRPQPESRAGRAAPAASPAQSRSAPPRTTPPSDASATSGKTPARRGPAGKKKP